MTTQITIYRGNDNLVENPTPMTRSSTGAYVNDASVTMTLKDSNGDAVVGASALSLAYVSDSNGRYQGTLPSSLTLTAGATYTLEITATSGSTTAFWTLSVNVVNRSS